MAPQTATDAPGRAPTPIEDYRSTRSATARTAIVADAPRAWPAPPTDPLEAVYFALRAPRQGEPLDQWSGTVQVLAQGVLLDKARYETHFGKESYRRDAEVINAGLQAIGGLPITLDHEGFTETLDELRTRIAATPGLSIGHKTAFDLPTDPPPPQLVGDFLTPEGPTVLYSKGGTGKGLSACYFAWKLVQTGHTVMVIDFEGHQRECGFRLRALGLSEDELKKIHYRAPYGEDWTAERGTLHDVMELVKADCDALGVTYLIVDSYVQATDDTEAMGGQAGAKKYFAALAWIGRPSLTIAHVKGEAVRFPDKPFGSIHIHTQARETWAVEAIDLPDQPFDPATHRILPKVVALEFRRKKSNTGGGSGKPQFLTFEFHVNDTINVIENVSSARDAMTLALIVLNDASKGLTYAEIRKGARTDYGEDISETTLRYHFTQGTRKREVRALNNTSPKKWVPA
jgi:hypothetical protein